MQIQIWPDFNKKYYKEVMKLFVILAVVLISIK